METPLISVLLPVYKHEAYLMDAVQSIINQTYQNWELLILNDNIEVDLTCYEFIDKRIKVFQDKGHKHKWSRINQGMFIAEGDFIAFQDADDISIPQRFALSYKFIDGFDFLYGDSISILKNGIQQYNKCQSLDIQNRPLGNQGSYFFYNQKLFPDFPEIDRGDDWLFIAEFVKANLKLNYLPLPLYYYRDYTGNFRKNSNRLKRYLSNRRLKKLVAEITKS